MAATDAGFIAAVEEAKQGFAEGGVPIGKQGGQKPSRVDTNLVVRAAVGPVRR